MPVTITVGGKSATSQRNKIPTAAPATVTTPTAVTSDKGRVTIIAPVDPMRSIVVPQVRKDPTADYTNINRAADASGLSRDAFDSRVRGNYAQSAGLTPSYTPVSRAVEESNAQIRYNQAQKAVDADRFAIGDIYSNDFAAREAEQQRREQNELNLQAADIALQRLGLKQPDTPFFERVGNTVAGAVKNTSADLLNAAASWQKLNPGPVNRLLDLAGLGQYQQTATDYIRNMGDVISREAAGNIEAAKRGASPLGQFAVDAGVSGLQMLGDAALNAVAPGTGLISLGARAAGGAARTARQAGADETQQILYGLGVGGVEVLSEKIFSPLENIYGKGFADAAAERLIGKLTQNAATPAAQAAIKLLSSAVEEGAEEVVAGVLDPALEYLYGGQGYSNPDLAADIAYDALVGAALGGIGGGVQMGINRAAYNAPYRGVSDGEEARNAGDGVPYGSNQAGARDGGQARNAGDGVPYGSNVAGVRDAVQAAQNAQDGPQTAEVNLPAEQQRTSQARNSEAAEAVPAGNGIFGMDGARFVNDYARRMMMTNQMNDDGVYALSAFYDGVEDSEIYIRGMTKAYNAGFEGLALNEVETPGISPAQTQAAWEAGRQEYERGVGGVSDEGQARNAVDGVPYGSNVVSGSDGEEGRRDVGIAPYGSNQTSVSDGEQARNAGDGVPYGSSQAGAGEGVSENGGVSAEDQARVDDDVDIDELEDDEDWEDYQLREEEPTIILEPEKAKKEIARRIMTPMVIDSASAHQLDENWHRWRSANMKRINISMNGKGASVDRVYRSLSQDYPDVFPADVSDRAQMVRYMLDAPERIDRMNAQRNNSKGPDSTDQFISEMTRATSEILSEVADAPVKTSEELAADSRNAVDEYFALTEAQAERVRSETGDAPADLVSTGSKKKQTSMKKNAENAWSYFKRKMVDSGEAVDRIGKTLKDTILYPYYNNARASTNAGSNMIEKKATNVRGDVTGKGLNEIFKAIKAKGAEYYKDFQLYLFHLHNIDRMSRSSRAETAKATSAFELFRLENPELSQYADYQIEQMANDPNSIYQAQAQDYVQLRDAMKKAETTRNKPVFGYNVSEADSRAAALELARTHPEFPELAEDVYAYTDNLLRYRVDSGLITEEEYRLLKSIYPHYVPTYRIFENNAPAAKRKGRIQIGKTVGKATGGTERLMAIDEALARQTMSVVREGTKNRFGLRLLNDVNEAKRAGSDRVKSKINELVYEINDFTGGFSPDSFDELQNRQEVLQKSNTFVVRDNGKLVEMRVSPALYEAVQALSPDAKESSALTKVIRGSNNMFKRLVTGSNPIFLVRNFARDLQDAGLYSKDLSEFAKQYPQAVREIATNGKYWQKYQALGGTYSSIFDYDTGTVKEPSEFQRKTVGRIEALNEAIEQAPRLAEFMATIKKNGGLDADMDTLMEGMYNAAEVTTNFGRSGTVGKILNANYIPFLNPGIQGFDKMIRNVTETKGLKNWLRLVAKAALFGVAPAFVSALIFGDDPEWDDLHDRDKDIYYLFKLKDGLWLKLPKGRTISVFGMAASRIFDTVSGKDVDWGTFVENALSQTAPANPLNENIMKAWFDADLLNKESTGRTWYGTDIESQRLQNLAPGQRYDARTDEISKWLGNNLDLSPKKINYLLDQYSGVVGDVVLPLLTPMAERDMFTAAFTLDSNASNRLSNDFYEMSDQLTFDKNDPNSTDVDAALYSYWNKQSQAVSEVNKEIRRIEADTGLKDSEKRELLQAQYKIRNAIEKQALQSLPAYRADVENRLTGYLNTLEDSPLWEAATDAARDKVKSSAVSLFTGTTNGLSLQAKIENAGVPEETYLLYLLACQVEDEKGTYNKDGKGKGSINQKEAEAAARQIPGLTQEQRRGLFASTNSAWKSNPF